MSNIGNFKRVGREVVYKGKILEFCQDEIQTSKGHHVTWDFLNHKGAAAIVPVMDDGKLVMSGTPREIFSQVEKLKKLRLDVPHVTELAYELQKEGVPLKNGILTSEEFTEELIRVRNEGFNVNNSR